MDPAPAPPPPVQWTPSTWDVFRTASSALCIYHGIKRNDGSLFWGLVWGGAGTLFPVVAPIVAVAQGFGKPAHDEVMAEGDWHYAARYLVTLADGRLITVWADGVQHALHVAELEHGPALDAKRIPRDEWSAPLKPQTELQLDELDYELARMT